MTSRDNKLLLDITKTSNDVTNPFRCYYPQNLGVNSNLSLIWSAVVHMERSGIDFNYTNKQVGAFINLSPRTVTSLIKELIEKGLLTSSGNIVRNLKTTDKSRKLAFTRGQNNDI